MPRDERIERDCERITKRPTRADLLEAFSTLVQTQAQHLNHFGNQPGFLWETAMNFAPAGPVREAASLLACQVRGRFLLRKWPAGVPYNPKPPYLWTLGGHSEKVGAVSLGADRRVAVSASDDETLKVWDVTTGKCLRTLAGHRTKVCDVSVSGDGRVAVFGSYDEMVKVWDLTTGRCLRTLEGHSDPVAAVSLDADGLIMVSVSWDQMLKVWNLMTGQCVLTLKG